MELITNKKYFLTFTSIFYLLIGLFAFGYGVSGSNLGLKGDKTFTISKSLEHGNRNFIIPCFLLSYIFTIILLKTKCKEYVLIRILLVTIGFIFFIIICWYTPTKNMELHAIFASIIISMFIIFTLISLYTLSYVSKYVNYIFVLLIVLIMILFTAGINGDFNNDKSKKAHIWTDIFAALEIIILLIYILTIIIIGLKN